MRYNNMTDLEKDEPSGLPCEREWDDSPWPWTFAKHKKQAFLEVSAGDWWCINDHTGCIYNDGQNTCGCEGDHPRPLESENLIKEKTDGN